MSAALELFELLKDAKPKDGPRHSAPVTKRPNAPALKAVRFTVELPELGGRADIVSVFREERIAIGEMSTRENSVLTRVDCVRCNQPRNQQLVGRTFAGGETWAVIPCTNCPLNLGVKP